MPLGLFYIYTQRYYVSSSRELQRLDSNSRSPIFAHFSETLAGTVAIRAFGEQATFCARNAALLDANQAAYFSNTSANRWLAVRLEFVGAIMTAGSAFFCVYFFESAQENPYLFASLAGLSISTALNITQTLNWMVRMSCRCP